MVSDTYAYLNGTDPEFYDDYIPKVCRVCGDSYYFEEYQSKDICFECDEEANK